METETALPITTERRGPVLILWIDSPPVNALGAAVRSALAQAISNANQAASVRSIVLLARGRTFPAGADISEFGKAPVDPQLPELCDLIEANAKPVVVGLHGTALGGGLELALAAHARVALADARVGLPEVALGILPGAGGTQRLPRLIGAEQALRLMISGKPIPAVEALALGILDKVVEHDLPEAAVAMALHLAGHPPVPTRARRDGFRDPKAYFAAVAEARRAQAAAPIPAPSRIIDCVEAAQLLPFDQGLAYERTAFAELVQSPEAEALRHVFFAERRMGRMIGAKAKANPVLHVTVLGAGADGVRLVGELLAGGYNVTLADHTQEALGTGLEAVATALALDLEAKRLSVAEHDARWARVVPAFADDEMSAADMLFLTGPYRLPGADVPTVTVKAGAPIVTMGRVGDGGARGLGLVLMPATANGKLAEVLVSDKTEPEAIATVLAVLKRLARHVVQGQSTGINAGLAVTFNAALQVLEAKHGPEPVLDLLGRWGMLRPKDRTAAPPKGRVDLFGGLAAPVMAALANAGLRMIGDETALRPSDIDVAMIMGTGFARWGGGPMLWAERRGLMVLRNDLNRMAEDDPDIWTPAPLLDDLIRQGISLGDLNEA